MRITLSALLSAGAILGLAACQALSLAPLPSSNVGSSADDTSLADFQLTPDSGATAAPKSHIFVTATGRLESFLEGDSGNVLPQTDITGAATLLGAPTGVAATMRGAPMTGSTSMHALLGWPQGDTGNVAPSTNISGPTSKMVAPQDVALDAAGNSYVADNASACNCLHVYAAGATGDVAPLRTIAGATTGIVNPKAIALDLAGNIWVATSSNGIREFTGMASGDVMPLRTITGVSSLRGIAVDLKGEILVTTSTMISVFAKNATGAATPIRTITDTKRNFHGLDTDVTGNIFVANSGLNGSQPEVDVYAAGANGMPSPMRIIAGASTNLSGISGVALQQPMQTVGARLIGQSSTIDPHYGFILGFFNGTTATTTSVVMLTAADPVQFKNVDPSLIHTVAFLGNATATSAPWPATFTGGTVMSAVGTAIGTTGFTTGNLKPGQKSKIYSSGGPGFYMMGCQYHYQSSEMRNVIVVL